MAITQSQLRALRNYAGIGRVVSAWSALEFSLDALTVFVRSAADQTDRAPHQFSAKVRRIREWLPKVRPAFLPHVQAVEAILIDATTLSTFRDQVVHGAAVREGTASQGEAAVTFMTLLQPRGRPLRMPENITAAEMFAKADAILALNSRVVELLGAMFDGFGATFEIRGEGTTR